MKKGDRVLTPSGSGTIQTIYNNDKLATVIHDDKNERGIDGYMVYWVSELKPL